MTLYEIKDDYLRSLENIEVNDDGEIINADLIEAAEGEFKDKAEAVGLFIKNLSAEAEDIAEEIKKLQDRKKAKDSKVENLKEYLSRNLRQAGIKKIETPKIEISFRKSERVEIGDESLLPEEYMTVTLSRKPDKVALKIALKSGTEVKGASLLSIDNLQIK